MGKQIEKTYWNGKGKNKDKFDEMWKLVPNCGEVHIPENTLHEEAIECVRAINKVAHEYYNNGGCNAVEYSTESCNHCDGEGETENPVGEDEEPEYETCYSCDGSGEEQGDAEIDRFYEDLLFKIESLIGNTDATDVLLEAGKNYGNYSFPDSDVMKLEGAMDSVIVEAWKAYKGDDLMEQKKDDTISRKQFRDYVKVQRKGLYNMLDARARELTGLTKKQYTYVLENYSKLSETYTNAV